MSQVVASHHEVDPGSIRSYSIGFALSIILTIAAYVVASHQLASNWTLIYVLVVLAVTQLFVQLVFFLHLGRGSHARWNLTVAAFAGMVVLILVIGSLWIMKHLNYSHDSLSPQQLNQSIIKDEGIQPSNY
jgi:cytochrome o ubiquinol oxidase operon protein cyoD